MKRPSVFFYLLFLGLLISSGIFSSFVLCFGTAAILAVLVRLLFQILLRFPVPKDGAVLISGCSSGFGEAYALRFAKLGLVVFAGVRSKAEGEHLIKQADPKYQNLIYPIMLDVTKKDEIGRAVIEVQGILKTENRQLKYVINNAGISEMGTFESIDEEKVQAVFDVNFFGVLRTTKAFLPLLKDNRDISKCRIVNMGSFAGQHVFPLFGAYSASKFALEAMSDQMRMELSIPTVLVEPGTFQTGLTKNIIVAAEDFSQIKEQYSPKLQRLHRLMTKSRGLFPDTKPVVDVVEYIMFARFPPVRALVGWDAAFFLSTILWFPDSIILGAYKYFFFD